MDVEAFARLWSDARTRVLTRRAEGAERAAARIRERAAADAEGQACACDEYAAACRAAATDPTLPTPAGPNYPTEESRG